MKHSVNAPTKRPALPGEGRGSFEIHYGNIGKLNVGSSTYTVGEGGGAESERERDRDREREINEKGGSYRSD